MSPGILFFPVAPTAFSYLNDLHPKEAPRGPCKEGDQFVLEFMCGWRTWFAILWTQHGTTCWTIKSSPLEILVQDHFISFRFWSNFISTWVSLFSPKLPICPHLIIWNHPSEITPLIITNHLLIFNPRLFVFNWDQSVLMFILLLE